MRPGFRNFQAVKKKEILADDRKGSIKAIDNGLILMPLYQKQGNDGFFLVRTIE
jgi:succinylglutamate desuccinylase